MPELLLSNARTLDLPLALCQQLSSLAYQRGLTGGLDRYSSDLLAGMQVGSQLSAGAINDDPSLGFNYQQAMQYLTTLSPTSHLSCSDICELHRQLNSTGGQLRRVKLRSKLRYTENQYLQPITKTQAIETTLTELLALLDASLAAGMEPLIAIPLFCLDFMRIFPFQDGKRRTSLLLARHLLARHGHPVVSYVDLESEFHSTEKAFYQSLNQSSQTSQPPVKWLAFWWVVLMRVYQRFNRQTQQAGICPGRGAKTALIEHFIAQQKQPFLLSAINSAFPTIGPDMIRVVLRKLRDEGRVQASGRGRGTTWSAIK
jgi:Fic family protein